MDAHDEGEKETKAKKNIKKKNEKEILLLFYEVHWIARLP